MTIETKFNINDLVQYKYSSGVTNKKTSVALEVIEINTINCYTTAQVFYICRAIHAITQSDFTKDGMTHKLLDFAPGMKENTEYMKFREDELKPCGSELQAEIKKMLTA